MKILLACSAGMSTSLIESKMNAYLKENKIDGVVEAMASGNAKTVVNEWDIVMIGPQVSFMEDEFKNITKKPVVVIPPRLYAMAKGKEILELALEVLAKNNG